MGDASGAPAGGTGGVARCHLERLGVGYDKNIKNRFFFETLFFSMWSFESLRISNRFGFSPTARYMLEASFLSVSAKPTYFWSADKTEDSYLRM